MPIQTCETSNEMDSDRKPYVVTRNIGLIGCTTKAPIQPAAPPQDSDTSPTVHFLLMSNASKPCTLAEN